MAHRIRPLAGVLVATIAGHPPITGRSTVLASAANAIRIGDPIVLQDVLPVGVYSGIKMLAVGRPQRMDTIATVDEERGLLQMTDGTLVRVTRTTNLHLGAASSSLTLTQVNSGDELIVVFADTTAEASPAEHATTYSSALPRQDVLPPGVEAGEVMIFRTSRRP